MKLYHFVAIALVALSLSACKDEPIETFPRKHLIEEFTGQGCGYCPYGMDCVHAFMANDTNYILILHHYGYQKDHFSVNGSKTITNALRVNGAPSVTVDRTPTTYMDEDAKKEVSETVFHPYYLGALDRAQYPTTTYATLGLENTYDASSRELKVKASGRLAVNAYPTLKLTVLVKESGMIDTQQDYMNTKKGWQEFRHTNAVRGFMTAAKGDDVKADNNRHYEAEYTMTLDSTWVADNCMVVAFLTEDFKPVVQAAEKPVVAGTKGGADIEHGGITPK